MLSEKIERGDRFVLWPDAAPRHRIYIAVTRVARDGSWVDISCQNWAQRFGKRVPASRLTPSTWRDFEGEVHRIPADVVRRRWEFADLVTQQADYTRALQAGVAAQLAGEPRPETVTERAYREDPEFSPHLLEDLADADD